MLIESKAKGGILEITINNWSKYNKRPDIKNPWWFAMSNRLLEDPDFFDFSEGEMLAWIYILSQASQKKKGTIILNFRHAQQVCRIKPKIMECALVKLSNLSMISITRTRSVRDPYGIRTPQDKTTQNNTIQNKTIDHFALQNDRVLFDFEKIYEKYPRKLGKQRGIEICKRKIKTEEKFHDLEKAVENYAKHCKNEDPKFIKHFSTFMGDWEDWIEPKETENNTNWDYVFSRGEYAKS